MELTETLNSKVVQALNLAKSYGTLKAVNAIDFSVNRQECFGLLGPNGAGKSTTVKMIYGLSPVTSGSLEVFGKDISSEARYIKSKIGVVAQEDNLDPELTVLENLVVFAGYFKISKRESQGRAWELLKFMELEAKAHTVVDHLSGGMKRRLTIARALINRPELIILDEPTTGLDPHARHMVWQKVRSLKEQGTTILLTTHYLEEASQLCDRLVFINDGSIIEEGRPQELIKTHIGSHVLELSAAEFPLSIIEKNNNLIKGYQKFGDTVYVYSGNGPGLQEKLHSLGLDFSYQLLRPATLEDVFLKLTGRVLEGGVSMHE